MGPDRPRRERGVGSRDELIGERGPARSRVLRQGIVILFFAAIQIVLSVLGPASILLPTGLRVTILELPAILAGVLGGPIAGLVVGLVFGIFALARATTPLFMNALIAIGPRVLIGPIAYAIYVAAGGSHRILALALAGAIGALANTGLVLLLATQVASPIGAPFVSATDALRILQGTAPAEMAIAAIATIATGVVAARIRI